MVETRHLSAEERDAITQLVRSPGWYIVMRDFLIPNMQRATKYLDSVSNITEAQANVQRGIKHSNVQQIEFMYRVAELPDPFKQHDKAMLTTLAHYAGANEAEGAQLLAHWILAGAPVCGVEGDEPIMGARSKGTVTCPVCLDRLNNVSRPQQPRPSQPV